MQYAHHSRKCPDPSLVGRASLGRFPGRPRPTLAFAAQNRYFREVQLGALASQLPTISVLEPTMGLTGLSGLPGHSQPAYVVRKRSSSKFAKSLGKGETTVFLWNIHAHALVRSE